MRGSEVSPSVRACTRTNGVHALTLEDLFVQRQVLDRAEQPLVLLLELLQTAEPVAAHPAILLTPAVESDLADPELADRVHHRHALAVQNLGLPQQAHNLLRLVSLPDGLRALLAKRLGAMAREGRRDDAVALLREMLGDQRAEIVIAAMMPELVETVEPEKKAAEVVEGPVARKPRRKSRRNGSDQGNLFPCSTTRMTRARRR